MKILSLFDGMACGHIAMQNAGVEIESYDAYEIDKYAIKVASHNFPDIQQHGDVFKADFTQYEGVDFVVGGSPCTYWSIAQKNNRETEASGLGWELFSQYVRAVREAKPRFFIYENNKSMSKQIRASIDETFGFEAVGINSALVSAQNRQRLYWVGKREADGTYSKVDVQQPEDRGILLKDILESGTDLTQNEKSYCLTSSYNPCPWNTIERSQRNMVAEPVNVTEDGKAHTLKAQYFKNGVANFVTNGGFDATAVAEPVRVCQDCLNFDEPGSNWCDELDITVQPDEYACDRFIPCSVQDPVCLRYERTEEAKKCRKDYEAGRVHHGFHELSELHPREDGKTNTLSTVLKDNPICEPVRIGTIENGATNCQSQSNRVYSPDGKSVTLCGGQGGKGAQTGLYAIPIEPVRIGTIESKLQNPAHDSKQYRVYSPDGKATTICGQGGGVGAKTGLYAVPVHENLPLAPFVEKKMDEIVDKYGYLPEMFNPYNKAEITDKHPTFTAQGGNRQTDSSSVFIVEQADKPIYEVRNGMITIKGKQYPIKLADGYYIIRKLTVRECMRLQTVPEWYDFSVISNSQSYKCLGNGWTCDVITHLIKSALSGKVVQKETDVLDGQINLFEQAVNE